MKTTRQILHSGQAVELQLHVKTFALNLKQCERCMLQNGGQIFLV